ncbi:MAG: LamG-like jellyroll fold domain-containing protein [Promethearchaeota archaeon]
MNKNRTTKLKHLVFILFFAISTLTTGVLINFSAFNSNLSGLEDIANPDDLADVVTRSSGITHVGEILPLEEWWNTTWSSRIGIKVENLYNYDRYDPVSIYMTFGSNDYVDGTERLVSYNHTGNNEWSDPIPIQVWNKSLSSGYVQSCTITFLANVSKNSNSTYYFYYNSNDNDIDTSYDYNTGFTNSYNGTALTVIKNGDYGSIYKLKLEQGKGVHSLQNVNIGTGGTNYHNVYSLAPELYYQPPDSTPPTPLVNIKMSEGSGINVADQAGSPGPAGTGTLQNAGADPESEWITGIEDSALNFTSSNAEHVQFGGVLENTGEPFESGATTWTMTAWINPTSLSTQSTPMGTQNVFVSKADNTIEEIFEIGVTSDGRIAIHLDCGNGPSDSLFDNTFGVTSKVQTGTWTFIALKVDLTLTDNAVGIRFNNEAGAWKYGSNVWNKANGIDDPNGCGFNIGASLDGTTPVYFDGAVDEVRFFNTILSDNQLNAVYNSTNPERLYTSNITSITPVNVGQVFSKYTVEWSQIQDMHVTDTCTFYWDYNLWNIERVISFDQPYDNNDTMIPMNTYYSFYSSSPGGVKYIYDDQVTTGISTAGNVIDPINYTVIHDTAGLSKYAFGIFTTNWTLSDVGTMEMNYFNGSVAYEDSSVKMYPGRNNDFDNGGGPQTKKLTIKFWEFIDVVTNTTNEQLINHFKMINTRLHYPLNIYLYKSESLKYDIKVYVENHDGRPVPMATVWIWNQSNTAINWSDQTDESGYATFTDFRNGTIYEIRPIYELNSTVSIEITSTKTLTDLAGNVNSMGIYQENFTDVSLTSLEINCSKNNTPMNSAYLKNVRYYYNQTSTILLGDIQANSSGVAIIRWRNSTIDGNVSFTLEWAGQAQNPLHCNEDEDGFDDASITLNFTAFARHNVTVLSGTWENYTTRIEPINDITCQLRKSFTITLNFSYYENGIYKAGLNGTVSMNLKLDGLVINTNPILLSDIVPLYDGIYSVTLDTSLEIESGLAWTARTYDAIITGTSPGFDTAVQTLNIRITPLSTRITTNTSSITAIWEEVFDIYVHYEYNNSGVWTGITGAEVNFVESLYRVGPTTMSHVGNGWYKLSISTTEFPNVGIFNLDAIASLQDYQTIKLSDYSPSRVISLTINEIPTKINGSSYGFPYFSDLDIYLGESVIFYFEYSSALTDVGIPDASVIASSTLENIASGTIISEKTLTTEGNGIYSVDFNTATLKVGEYRIMATIKEVYYKQVVAYVNLEIKKRDFSTTALTFYSVVSGAPEGLLIEICLVDKLSNNPITDISPGRMNITFLGQIFNFEHKGAGCYEARITNIPAGVLVFPELYNATIRISRENYTTIEDRITIHVALTEIFPGMPLIFFLFIIAAAIIVVASVVTYRVIQVRRIPKFIKKSKNLIKAISSESNISDSLMYPSKEAFIAKKFADNWKIHDLSLSEIMGIGKGKRSKKLPEDKLTDAKGGVA